MGFFQSFISDANRGRQAEPVTLAPVAESLDRLTPPADAMNAHNTFTDPPRFEEHVAPEIQHYETQAPPGIQRNVFTESVFEDAEQPVFTPIKQHIPNPRVETDPRVATVPQNKTAEIPVQTLPPVVESKPVRKRRKPAESATTDEEIKLPIPRREIVTAHIEHASNADSVTAPATTKKLARMELSRNTALISRNKREDIFSDVIDEKISTSPVRRTEFKSEPVLETVETSKALEAPARNAKLNDKENNFPVLPVAAPFEAGRQYKQVLNAIPVMSTEIRPVFNTLESKEAAENTAPAPTPVMPVTPVTVKPDAQEREAAKTAETKQRPVNPFEAMPSFASLMEKPTPVREKNEPRVRIGTIEVIVESAPAIREKPTPDIVFTRDPGRYYQRRI